MIPEMIGKLSKTLMCSEENIRVSAQKTIEYLDLNGDTDQPANKQNKIIFIIIEVKNGQT
jgi:hypothetical protein